MLVLQPMDSMAKDRRAVKRHVRRDGDRRSALVGVGTEAVSTNQVREC